jgi:hypothetical protein
MRIMRRRLLVEVVAWVKNMAASRRRRPLGDVEGLV